MDKVELGQKIRNIRKEKGYTQEQFAEMAGISTVYLGEVERGIKSLSLNLFIKIIKALDISADSVLRDELPSGKQYVYDDITIKLEKLTPKQRKTICDIIDAYIKNVL